MGNDGGSIPKRRELVKEAAKALTSSQLKEAQIEQQEYGWSTDPLTRKPLARPVVSDAAGVLYNKDSIIEYLLKDDEDAEKVEMRKVGGVKGTVDSGFADLGTFGDRVKGLKDVVEVRFEVAAGEEKGRVEKWVCPITGTPLGPGAKAVYIVPCGHAFAGSMVKEVAGNACLTCNEPYAENDIIPILATTSIDLARLNLRIKTLRESGLTHALKKAPGSKKRKKNAEPDKATNGTPNGTSAKISDEVDDDNNNNNNTKAKRNPPTAPAATTTTAISSPSNGLKNTSTASLTRKVLDEQTQLHKRRKLAQNDNVKSLFSTSDGVPKVGNSADYMTRGFSIGRK
ncbi:Replication termination factor 2 [Coniothyrium glycines]